MKFNYCFEFAADKSAVSRKVLTSVNGTDDVPTACENDKVSLDFAVNEQFTLYLMDLDGEGRAIRNKLIIKDHKVTGAKFKPEKLQGTTIKVTKISEEPPVEPPAAPEPPVEENSTSDEPESDDEQVFADPANPEVG